MDVTFVHVVTSTTYVVPGYYAADGNAANTSAASGNIWRVHFAPDETGDWNYTVSFRTGTNVAMAESNAAGNSAGFFDGETGTFSVAESDKLAPDFRARGRLEYVNSRYLRFRTSGEYFLKQGADAPENLLAYEEFDGPFANDGNGDVYVKDWSPHVADWQTGDPTWGNQKGKGIIGAINYLASEKMNAFSFLTMNITGDDKNVFPYIDYNERLRMDVSRLAQWEIVFEHADQLGMFLHFKTQETENDQLLDGGSLGDERRLYYRELIARFSHHLALNWNLGEENTNTTQQRKDFAQFFYDHDPYRHHIVIHTYPNQQDSVYGPLLGTASELTGASIQTSHADFRRVHDDTARWVRNSAASGRPWAIAVDEPGDAQHAIRPDNDAGNSHEDGRKNALWGALLAGGWGCEYYFGYAHAHSDLTLQDFRSRDAWWDYCRIALNFFNQNEIPFWEMNNDNSISSAADDYCFYSPGSCYVVYLKSGGSTTLDLSGLTGSFEVRWFDPRNGGALQIGSVNEVIGGGDRDLGQPPSSPGEDWVILVTGDSTPGDILTFTPSDDATVEGATGVNDQFIKVQNANPVRTGYFKFNVQGIVEPIASATLRLTVSQDPGNGTLQLYRGQTNDWTESTINASNAPQPGDLIDSIDGNHGLGSTLSFDVSSMVNQNGTYTMVLTHAGGSDVWFSSKEGVAPPQLVVVTESGPQAVNAQTLTILNGSLAAGGLDELGESDDLDLGIARSVNDIQSRTRIELESTSPIDNPAEVRVTLEASVFARSTVHQSIELFDFESKLWEIVDIRDATRFVDSVAQVTMDLDPSRFVEPTTGRLLARIQFESPQARQRFASNIDHFFWTITP